MERWKSRGSEKPTGERLSACEECKAKMVTEIRESWRFWVWRESFEQEILKCRLSRIDSSDSGYLMGKQSGKTPARSAYDEKRGRCEGNKRRKDAKSRRAAAEGKRVAWVRHWHWDFRNHFWVRLNA
ncbi:hypothetical protein K438DRAFT_1764844 [Mycena galopus ATCC 62051]|nr:hypothetical protein K438DRAFT_1764844 [Mycena galopus ATCC 62051]